VTVPAGAEVGYASGTPGWSGSPLFGLKGWPEDPSEQNLDLLWPLSVKVYDRMRRDPKLAQVLSGWIHPIRSTAYTLDPAGCSDQVAREVSEDLGVPIMGDDSKQAPSRAKGRFSWKNHVRHACLAFTYGHMPFEILCDPDLLASTGKARLRKLAPRMPQTLEYINVARDGGLESIQQYPSGFPGEPVLGPVIDVSRLVMYVNEREGGAWAGQSLLRPSYGPWYLKQDAMRTHAVSIRRNGMGIPVGEAPEGAGKTQIDEIAKAAQALRAGEYAGGAVPHGGKIRLLGVEGSLPDVLGFIRYCDEQMAGSALQEFLKLGSSSSGSRALGETFLWQFAMALNAAAEDLIADTTNEHVIADLVEWNYGPDEPAPRIVPTQIDVESQAVAQSVAALVSAGAMQMDDELHAYLRQTLGLPLPAKTWQTPKPAPQTPPAGAPDVPAGPVAASAVPSVKPRSSTPPREMTPEEKQSGVDFTTLNAAWQDELDQLMPQWKLQRDTMLTDLLSQVAQALDDGDLAALGTLSPVTGLGGQLLQDAMLRLADAAALEAQAEAGRQGVTVDVPAYATDNLAARAQLVDQLMAGSLTNVVSRQALARWTDGVPTSEVTAGVRDYVNGLSDTYLTDSLGGALTAAQNHARLAVMANGPVQELYASELLDGATCVNCQAKDGTRYTSVTSAERDYPTGGFKDCLGGTRCRGTLVAIYAQESTATVAARVAAQVVAEAMAPREVRKDIVRDAAGNIATIIERPIIGETT
jgi:hypothetical protein